MSKKDSRWIDRYFTRRMFTRQFLPALVSAVVLTVGDVADGLVLGNSIGFVGLAALALAMPVCRVFSVIMNSFSSGGSVRYAAQMAQGRTEEARRGFQGTVCCAALIGVLIALLGDLCLTPLLSLLGTVPSDGALFSAAQDYLRILLPGSPVLFLNYVLYDYLKTDNKEKAANAAFSAGNIVDIVLNIVFVLLMRMGAAGAALATVAGQAVGMTISLLALRIRPGNLRLVKPAPDFREARIAFRVGFTSSVGFLYEIVFLLLANRLLLNIYGYAGAAALEITLSVSYLMTNIYDAVAKSMIPVVSTYSGEKNENGTHQAMRVALRYTLAAGLLMALAADMFPGAVCSLFGADTPGVMEICYDALRDYSIGIPLAGIGILLINYYEARQDLRMTLMCASLRGLFPILTAILFAWLSPDNFWMLFPASEALTLAAAFIRNWRRPRKSFDQERVFRASIFSTSRDISRTTEQIDAFVQQWGASPGQRYMAMAAVEEICVATMNNGFQNREDGFIQIVLVYEGQNYVLHIRDNARSFNPLAMETDGGQPGEDINPDTAGIRMIRKKARSFSYRNYQGLNTVIICF